MFGVEEGGVSQTLADVAHIIQQSAEVLNFFSDMCFQSIFLYFFVKAFRVSMLSDMFQYVFQCYHFDSFRSCSDNDENVLCAAYDFLANGQGLV